MPPITHLIYLAERPGRLPLSGAENHLWVLLTASAKRGLDVELIAVLWGGSGFDVTRGKLDELRVAGVSITTVTKPSWGGWLGERAGRVAAWFGVWRQLCLRRRRIIHLHLDFKYSPFIAWLAGCRRIVLSIHNDLPIFAKLQGGLLFRGLDRVVSHYIAISHRVHSYFLATSGTSPAKITTIYYGLPEPVTSPLSRRDLGVPEDGFLVGFVGRLTEQKNLFTLVDAVKDLQDVRVVLIGGGPDRGRLLERLASRGQTNVYLTGPLADAERFMPAFNVLCLPSHWEGLGLVLIEAMFRRVPIIGSNRGAIAEILDGGRRGLLFEPDEAGIAAAIQHARDHYASTLAVADSALADARKTFTVARMVDETCRVYELLTPVGTSLSSEVLVR